MTNMRRRAVTWLASLAAVPILPARAQLRSRPIRFVVGFDAGSSTDVIARIVANGLTRDLGLHVIVENLSGANGMLAAAELEKEQDRALTVLISNSSTVTLNPLLYKKLPYDVRNMKPVSLFVTQPLFLTINPENERFAQVQTVQDFVKLCQSKPGELSFGSAGLGNVTQLCFELMNKMAGTRMTHIPYRGTASMRTAILKKEVDAGFDALTALPLIQAGKLKFLAVTTPSRLKDLPQVTTMQEAGFDGYDMGAWAGAIVNVRTPRETTEELYAAIQAAMKQPATLALLEAQGQVQNLSPQGFAEKIKAESDRNASILKDAAIQMQG